MALLSGDELVRPNDEVVPKDVNSLLSHWLVTAGKGKPRRGFRTSTFHAPLDKCAVRFGSARFER